MEHVIAAHCRRSLILLLLRIAVAGDGGGSGIRTHGGVNLTGFQDRRLRPLGHPSATRSVHWDSTRPGDLRLRAQASRFGSEIGSLSPTWPLMSVLATSAFWVVAALQRRRPSVARAARRSKETTTAAAELPGHRRPSCWPVRLHVVARTGSAGAPFDIVRIEVGTGARSAQCQRRNARRRRLSSRVSRRCGPLPVIAGADADRCR